MPDKCTQTQTQGVEDACKRFLVETFEIEGRPYVIREEYLATNIVNAARKAAMEGLWKYSDEGDAKAYIVMTEKDGELGCKRYCYVLERKPM